MHTTADRVSASRNARQRAGLAALRSARRAQLPAAGTAPQAAAPLLHALLAGAGRLGALPAPLQALIGDSAVRRPEGTLAQRAPTASTSEKRPELEALADDKVVDAAIAADWKASNPNGPGAKKEHGFWVLRSGKGVLSVQAFPSNGTRDSLTPGPMPAGAIAFFHTHPNTSAEGYDQAPSDADKDFADAVGLPGLVMSHDGMFYFGPALKK